MFVMALVVFKCVNERGQEGSAMRRAMNLKK